MSTQPVLVVEHETDCPPGWVGDWLVEAGCELDVRRPYRGDPLPDDLTGHRSVVVLGGSMDANADELHPWLTQVKRLAREAAETGFPMLGICLGHQLIAVALGGTVARNPRGQQIGVLEPGWLPAAASDPLFGSLTDARVSVQWNNDVVVVMPPGAEVLAQTPDGEVQVARYAPTVWGVQSHPEAGVDIIGLWAAHDRDNARERGVDVDEYLAAVAHAKPVLQAAWRPLATGFAALTRDVVAAW